MKKTKVPTKKFVLVKLSNKSSERVGVMQNGCS